MNIEDVIGLLDGAIYRYQLSPGDNEAEKLDKAIAIATETLEGLELAGKPETLNHRSQLSSLLKTVATSPAISKEILPSAPKKKAKTKTGAKASIDSNQLESEINQLVENRSTLSKSETEVILKNLADRADLHPIKIDSLYRGKLRQRVTEELQAIAQKNLHGTELEIELQRVKDESNLPKRELDKLYGLTVKEVEENESWQEETHELAHYIKLSGIDLNLDFLPDPLANAINRVAYLLGVKPAACFTTLLVGLSSVVNAKTRLHLAPEQHFSESANLFGGIVGEGSSRKSAILSIFVLEPLNQLQMNLDKLREREMLDYEENLQEFHRLRKEINHCKETETREALEKGFHQMYPEGEPREPKKDTLTYFVTSGNSAGFNNQFARFPNKTILYVYDELKHLFSGIEGDGVISLTRAELLAYYSGSVARDLRSEGVIRKTNKALLSVFGAIQPKVLLELMGTCEDEDGMWSRFIWVHQPKNPKRLHSNNGQSMVKRLLIGLYSWFNTLHQQDFYLDAAGWEYFRQQHDEIERKSAEDKLLAMSAYYSKSIGRIARIAIILHHLHHYFDWFASMGEELNSQGDWNDLVPLPNPPESTIPKARLEEATKLVAFYCNQVRKFLADAPEEGIGNSLKAIVNLSRQRQENLGDGWITASMVKRYNRNFRNASPQEIRAKFEQLRNLGFGHTEGGGSKLKFCFLGDA
ncbi:DUF3987 domain-containing protein [Picosynechococcus sp. PCC 8807]|uniref:DUF3987 domain-containing protein n=1 Tax=Picosynechococcus sp. PCC 8807 TaxID=195248 RepID=UPI0008105692|nr:DUF3987 domain-containing protein [Picosynechococcus sp. PCC 8807]ANV92022.1 hypothetical protein AWQ24_14680 [Picosynechococcus sp. PCC 8807]